MLSRHLFALKSIPVSVAKRCFSVNTVLSQSIRDDVESMFESSEQRGGGRFQGGGRDGGGRFNRMQDRSRGEGGGGFTSRIRSAELPESVIDKALDYINNAQNQQELMKFRGVKAIFANDVLRERQRGDFTSFADFCNRVNHNMSLIKTAFEGIATNRLSLYGLRAAGVKVDPITAETMYNPVPRASFFEKFTGKICSYHVSRFQMRYAIIDVTRDGEKVTAKLTALEHSNLSRDQQHIEELNEPFSVQDKYHVLKDALMQKRDDLMNCDLYIRTGVNIGTSFIDQAKLEQVVSDNAMDALMIAMLEMNSEKKLIHTEFRPRGIAFFLQDLDGGGSIDNVFNDIVSGNRPNSLDRSDINSLSVLEGLPRVQRFMMMKIVLQAAGFVETVLKAK